MNRYTLLSFISFILLFVYVKYVLNISLAESVIPIIFAAANWILGGQKTKEDVRNENIQQEYNLLKKEFPVFMNQIELKHWVDSTKTDFILQQCIYPKKNLESKRKNLKTALDEYSIAWSRYSNSKDPNTGQFVIDKKISEEIDLLSAKVLIEWNSLIETYQKLLGLKNRLFN